MSITRWYEACCDNCGAVINHYIHYKPTIKELKKDCGKVIINNGKVITICDECNKKDKRVVTQNNPIKIGNGIVDRINRVDIIGGDEKLTIENIDKFIKDMK